MLRTLIYIALYCFPQFAFSQFQLDSVVVYQDSLKIVTRQFYDPEYLQLEVHREQYQPGKPMIGLEKTWIQYDAWHNEVLRVDSKWDTTQREWVETEKRERQYDTENRMTAYTEYQRNAAQWEGTLRTTREYIQQDQIISTDFVWANGNWVPKTKTQARFNTDNDEIQRLTFAWDSLQNDWRHQEKHEFIYQGQNLLLQSLRYTWNGHEWQNEEKNVYEYNMPDSTSMTDHYVYTARGDNWQEKQRTIISYYDSARRNEIFTWSEEEEGWLRETLSESYFDRHGRETDFLYKSAKYGVHFQRLTIFDDHGRITLSQEIGYDGTKHAFGTQTSFVYDEHGNTLREQDKYLDVEHGRWILAEERAYSFDKNIALIMEDGTRLQDKGSIGLLNIVSNKHAITQVDTFRYVDGKPALQEYTRLYYSPL